VFGTNTDVINVALTNNVGGLPGGVIESFSIGTGILGTLGDPNPLIVENSSLHPSLLAGTQYWITVSLAAATSSVAWNWNNTSDPADEALSLDGGTTWGSYGLTPGAFEVDGTPATVPEPGTIFLLGSGLAGLAGFRKKFRA
jgi:hypothetical protein